MVVIAKIDVDTGFVRLILQLMLLIPYFIILFQVHDDKCV